MDSQNCGRACLYTCRCQQVKGAGRKSLKILVIKNLLLGAAGEMGGVHIVRAPVSLSLHSRLSRDNLISLVSDVCSL